MLSGDFSSDAQNLCCCTSSGISILNPKSKSHEIKYINLKAKRCVSIPNSSFIVFIGQQDDEQFNNTKLCVYDNNTHTIIFEDQFNEEIISLKSIQCYFAAATRFTVRVYSFDPIMIIYQFRTVESANAPLDIAEREKSFVVGFSGFQAGTIRIVNGDHCFNQDITIAAHNHPVSILSFDKTGRFIASASNQGTLIRLFSVESSEKLAEFRRGSFASEINSIVFNIRCDLLAASSSKTIHVFPFNSTRSETIARSELMWPAPQSGVKSLAFDSEFPKHLYVISSDGHLMLLKCHITKKQISIENDVEVINDFSVSK